MHRLATIHNVTDRRTDRRNSVAIARPLVRSAKNYLFRMNIMEEIFEIKTCLEILVKDIKIYKIDLQHVP